MADEVQGERLLELVAVMDRLRSPGGCNWDAQQTHESLLEYLVEETYETVEAIELADRAGMREELGDLLLQVMFHSRIAQEDATDPFDIDDVAAGITSKLIARHPHVFGDVDASTAEEIEANWHALKAKEKGRESVTDGIPAALPALLLAGKIISRSERLPERPDFPRMDEAELIVDELEAEEFGDLLFALVAESRSRGIDAEAALRDAVRRRRAEIRASEGLSSI